MNNIAQNWRLNKQRYQLKGIRFENGEVAFPPREFPQDAETLTRVAEVIRMPLNQEVELRKAGR